MANKGKRMVFEEDIKKIGQGGGTEYTAGNGINISDEDVISAKVKAGSGIVVDEDLTDDSVVVMIDQEVIPYKSDVNRQIAWLTEKTGAWYDNHNDVDLTAFTTKEVNGNTVYDITGVLQTFTLIKTSTCSDTFAQSFENDYNGVVAQFASSAQASSVPTEGTIYGAYFLVDDRDASNFKITLVATTSETTEIGRPMSTKYARKRIIRVGGNDFKFLFARANKINLGLGYYDGNQTVKLQYIEAFGKTINPDSIRTINFSGTGTSNMTNVSSDFNKVPIQQVVIQAQYPITTNSTNSSNYQISPVPSTQGTYVLKATVDANGVLTKIEWVAEAQE